MKVGKREHPEHILNQFFETFIVYSTGRCLQSNEGGPNNKNNSKYVLFPSMWLSFMLVFVFLQRGQKSL